MTPEPRAIRVMEAALRVGFGADLPAPGVLTANYTVSGRRPFREGDRPPDVVRARDARGDPCFPSGWGHGLCWNKARGVGFRRGPVGRAHGLWRSVTLADLAASRRVGPR